MLDGRVSANLICFTLQETQNPTLSAIVELFTSPTRFTIVKPLCDYFSYTIQNHSRDHCIPKQLWISQSLMIYHHPMRPFTNQISSQTQQDNLNMLMIIICAVNSPYGQYWAKDFLSQTHGSEFPVLSSQELTLVALLSLYMVYLLLHS